MALAKDETTSSSFYVNMLEHGSSIQFPYMDPYVLDEYIQIEDNQDGLETRPINYKITTSNNQLMNYYYSSSISNSSSGNSFFQSQPPHEEAHSLLNFKSGFENFVHSSEKTSLLSFHHGQLLQGCSGVISSSSSSNNNNSSRNLPLLDEARCLQTMYEDETNEWLFDETTLADLPLENRTQRTSSFNKRPQMEEENMQALKKQCIISPSKKPVKPKSSTTKDPQSIAAKNRRERISERLKILQDLVPNGSKVDLVTMLEKAINYVKFLQLQVKVLAADEFWPEAGGKTPDISQVREAIDTILSSQRIERSSTR